MHRPDGDKTLWVFGYGSLIWDPGFDVVETSIARLDGWQRSFCMRSIHHRGTPEEPGLVLALDKTNDAYCDGVLLRAAPGTEEKTIEYLRERELISSAYLEIDVSVVTRDGRTLDATTFVIDPDHVQYCGGLELETQAKILAKAVGGRGPNWEYLYNTCAQITELGLEDDELHWLRSRVEELRAS